MVYLVLALAHRKDAVLSDADKSGKTKRIKTSNIFLFYGVAKLPVKFEIGWKLC